MVNAASPDRADHPGCSRSLTEGDVEHKTDIAFAIGNPDTSHQAVRVRQLQAVPGLHAEHRATEEDPRVESIPGQAERGVDHRIQARTARRVLLIVRQYQADL